MPFEGVDPWRWQYFERVAIPASVVVPVDDATGWRLFPRYRYVYDKLFICESQGIPHGPHGVMPGRFPVFSKPVSNFHGMGIGGRIIRSAKEYEAAFTPGHMWMQLLTGKHVSTDVALEAGAPRWWRHTTGKALPRGMFDYWTIHARPLPRLRRYVHGWIRRHLRGFTGIVNFETIGGKIIECHLRMSEQWVDLNGPGWLESVVRLYARGRWRFADRPRTGYSVVLFGSHGTRYAIAPQAVDDVRRRPGVSSVQITYRTDKPLELHAMPPGGFRLAIVNCWELRAGLAARRHLKRCFRAVLQRGEPQRPAHRSGRPAPRRAPAGRAEGGPNGFSGALTAGIPLV